jgi:hypothetical protein
MRPPVCADVRASRTVSSASRVPAVSGAVIVIIMTSASAAFGGEHPVSASTPREIRAVLTGDEAGHFDQEYRQAMTAAAESLDLSDVLAVLRRWQRVAWSASDDPAAHQHMLDSAARLAAGETVPTVPWEQVKARFGA